MPKLPSVDEVLFILKTRADEAHMADHMESPYMVLTFSDETLFIKGMILGLLMCETQEGVLIVPFRTSDVDDGYEQFDIDDARIAESDDLAYIKQRVDHVYNAQSGYLNNIMKKEGDQV
jgi:hypothetical protein